jgi:hypothetical protein
MWQIWLPSALPYSLLRWAEVAQVKRHQEEEEEGGEEVLPSLEEEEAVVVEAYCRMVLLE